MVRSGVRSLVMVLALGLAGPAAAQPEAGGPGTIYRVFLTDGRALPSYGEAAEVDDRVVFNLLVHRSGSGQQLQLVSLPSAAVDVARTLRYAEAMRAGLYAATRGEADYAAMTGQVARTLDEISKTEDRRARLQLAEQARQRLLTWSREHYGYRDGDLRELVGLFEALVNELRAESGDVAFSFDLVAGSGTPVREPLLPSPTPHETIALALAAAEAADIVEERLAILRSAATAASAAGAGDLANRIAAELNAEVRATADYRALAAEVGTRAAEAVREGDVPAIDRLQTELADRDRQLGSRRPQEIAALVRDLREKLNAARAYRLALDHYAYVRASLLAYERRIRPALSGLDGLKPVLQYVRDGRSMAFERVETAVGRLERFEADASTVAAPEDLSAVHATFMSALRMAREALARRRMAVITNHLQTDLEASAAAAGALLLADRARADLIEGLFPPKPR